MARVLIAFPEQQDVARSQAAALHRLEVRRERYRRLWDRLARKLGEMNDEILSRRQSLTPESARMYEHLRTVFPV